MGRFRAVEVRERPTTQPRQLTLVASQAGFGIFEILAECTGSFHIGNPTELDASLRGDWRVRYLSLLSRRPANSDREDVFSRQYRCSTSLHTRDNKVFRRRPGHGRNA